MREAYVQVDPEAVRLQDALTGLRLDREQLVDLGILIGTDFNPDGFKGIGPKTALKLMQEHGSIEKIAQADPEFRPPEHLSRIRQIFLKPDVEGLVSFLCGDRDFSKTVFERRSQRRSQASIRRLARRPWNPFSAPSRRNHAFLSTGRRRLHPVLSSPFRSGTSF